MTFVSREKLFQTPVITRLVSEIDTPGSLLQRVYGLTPNSPRSNRVQGRAASWDLFHATRSIATVRAPRTGPAQRSRKPFGTRSAQLVRIHEKLFIGDEDLMRFRPAGAPLGSVDLNGQTYVRQQLAYFTQIFRNTREWMISRMFRNGFGVKVTGDEYQLVERGDANALFTVDYGIPSDHFNQLNGLVDSSWDDPSTDIIGQLMALEVQAERENGRPPRHIWLNGNTAKHLFNNTQLSAVRGTAMRIFDSQTRREIDAGSRFPDTGYDIVFGAIPLYTFHVYNGGLVKAGTGEGFDAQISASNFEPFIPDNSALITPEPGDWLGMMEGSEYVRENVTVSQMSERYGMAAWATPVIDPSGVELKMLDNCLPVVYEPYAIYFADVVFAT